MSGLEEPYFDYSRISDKRVLLSFSRGKDSIAVWCALREAGFSVVPFHMMHVPDLKFVDDSLAYYEDFFQEKIYRVLHPSALAWPQKGVLQTPESFEAWQEMTLPKLDMDNAAREVKRAAGLDLNTWHAVGVRAADSPIRRNYLKKCNGADVNKRKFYPLWEWKKDHLIQILKRHNVKLPIDYKYIGRSWDGVSWAYSYPLSQFAPEDFERLKRWYPFVQVELERKRFEDEAKNKRK